MGRESAHLGRKAERRDVSLDRRGQVDHRSGRRPAASSPLGACRTKRLGSRLLAKYAVGHEALARETVGKVLEIAAATRAKAAQRLGT